MKNEFAICLRETFIRVMVVAGLAISVPGTALGQLTFSIPETLSGMPGQTINIPVNFTVVGNQLTTANGNGIGAVSFVITHDSSLSSSLGTFALGSLLSEPSYGFSNYTINNTLGLIRAVTASTLGTPGLIAGTNGSVAVIPFTISPMATPGTYPIDFLGSSGASSSSIVDNNFNTYAFGSGLTFSSGTITVAPVPEPSCVVFASLFATMVARTFSRRSSAHKRLGSNV